MSRRLAEGKVPWELIAESISRVLPPDVLLGPGPGEDAALLRIGEEVWAVASDPITFTASAAGRLAVIVNANDIAVRGATPRFFTVVLLVSPGEASDQRIKELLGQVSEACAGLGVTLIGGHTEVTPGLSQSIVVGTMLGPVTGRPITTGGLQAGDLIGLSGWAGLEGSSILLDSFGEGLAESIGEAALTKLREVLAGDWLSVLPEAAAAARIAGVSALHDVTEGGVGEALHELATASGLALDVEPELIPVLEGTQRIAELLGIDPFGLIGSGALLIGCAEKSRAELESAFSEQGLGLSWIGRAVASSVAGCPAVARFPRDELLRAQALDGIEAVLFDMDGTLIDSSYDWQRIREMLGVSGRSIIDELNELPEPERRSKWQLLEEIEERATDQATLMQGAGELLQLLRRNGLATALVTNNNQRNTQAILERFSLEFDVVLTRDSGCWKPSGRPLTEALRRLEVEPGRSLAVGDSLYDLQSAREAGCARTCILHARHAELGRQAELGFPDLPTFIRFLGIVLR